PPLGRASPATDRGPRRDRVRASRNRAARRRGAAGRGAAMSHGLPARLVTYLAERDAQRAAEVDALFTKLTARERGLFHDAAVMGYIQGLMRDRTDGVPKDSRVMTVVAEECLALPDLYP